MDANPPGKVLGHNIAPSVTRVHDHFTLLASDFHGQIMPKFIVIMVVFSYFYIFYCYSVMLLFALNWLGVLLCISYCPQP